MRRLLVTVAVSLTALLGAAGPLAASPAGTPVRYVDSIFSTVRVRSDITYGTAVDQITHATVTLKLDLYTPVGDTNTSRPAIVWVHGGSFCCGDKTSPELVDEANQFAMKGYVNVSIDYRLANPGCVPGGGSTCLIGIKEALQDAQTAVRFLRARAAELGIDPTRIAIGGSSAGAITAVNVGYGADLPASGGHRKFSSAVEAVQSLSGCAITTTPGPGGALVPAAGSLASPTAGVEPVPLEVALAFHPRTFAQLLFVRTVLRIDDRVDRFLAAGLTGILHGKSASYLSEVMPNTFSMARGYVRDYVARTDFHSPERDVFGCLDRKLTRLYRQPLPASTGIALLGDARDAGARARTALRARALPDRARLVVTSPPYLRVVKYGYYNWMRAWLLGEDPVAIDAALDDAHHRTAYLQFMREVLDGLRHVLADDAVVVLVIGDES